MTMNKIMYGKPVADAIYDAVKDITTPAKLVIATFGEDEASEIYMRNKMKAAKAVGIEAERLDLDKNQQAHKIMQTLANTSQLVDGLILQLPLPKEMRDYEQIFLDSVNVYADVDCLGREGIGNFYSHANSWQVPCTAQAVVDILKFYGVPMAGKHAVVIGRSKLVGRPVAELLLRENATVTICHSATENLAEHTKCADIIITAAGTPNLITADMVKDGVVIVDVSINRGADGKLCGDVDFNTVAPKCAAITPVPGGVGPVTVAELMANTAGIRAKIGHSN